MEKFNTLPGNILGNSLNTTKNYIRVIGIDPGLAATGFGIIDYCDNSYRYVTHGCIKTDTSLSHGARLGVIFHDLETLLAKYKPDGAGIETLYFAKNVKSAMPVAEARGVISFCLDKNAITLKEFTPLTIKKSVTGTAKADKELVQNYVKVLLSLNDIPRPDHAADALAAAITYVHHF